MMMMTAVRWWWLSVRWQRNLHFYDLTLHGSLLPEENNNNDSQNSQSVVLASAREELRIAQKSSFFGTVHIYSIIPWKLESLPREVGRAFDGMTMVELVRDGVESRVAFQRPAQFSRKHLLGDFNCRFFMVLEVFVTKLWYLHFIFYFLMDDCERSVCLWNGLPIFDEESFLFYSGIFLNELNV